MEACEVVFVVVYSSLLLGVKRSILVWFALDAELRPKMVLFEDR